jgi:hypothetical protein
VSLTTGIALGHLAEQLVTQLNSGQLEHFIENLLSQSEDSRLCRRIGEVARMSAGTKRKVR